MTAHPIMLQKEGVVFAVPSFGHTVCLEFLRAWEAGPTGYRPPTIREIMNGAGLQMSRSTSVVWDNLRSLNRKGYITMEARLARTIRLTKGEVP